MPVDPFYTTVNQYMKMASEAAGKGDTQMAGYYAQKAMQVAKGAGTKATSSRGTKAGGPLKYRMAKGGTLKKGKAAGKPVSRGASRGKSKK